MTSREYRK